ncbi:UDP-glucose dehydrogenase family protein [Massilia pseudoviolaceinigra]|uniref:UDP-glucose dehydrogenase family protein n=1 Tax=Massilia pseudoviolaceinigra TaxID=3057165 RepID=UPI00279681B3|nr:UDP-glucose/GDP-mannose dehydrogenase family protein [Massilia sp. CCM 9206]MDQ1920907.1 UDP-glucose/GDP-mannose dehydrogenase family protein [Massilia sp. CCM 9206]
MKITVIGTGYVGLVTGTCLAEVGNDVLCLDLDVAKVANLRQGRIPIHEPGLEAMVQRNARAGRLRFSTDIAEAVQFGSVQFIAVGTPADEDGDSDIQHVLAAARNIGRFMTGFKLIVNKSTVPVGTAERVAEVICKELAARASDATFEVASNPEFLKEGAAVADFMRPDRIVIGTSGERAGPILLELYAPFQRNHERMVTMDVRSAELTKYAANAMLATRISFMNELANLSDAVGADIERVRQGIGADERIGYHFLYAGTGYGGSCFPKDVQALRRMGQQVDVSLRVVAAVEQANAHQKYVLTRKLVRRLGNDLRGKRIAIWGLAFKPDTDDMREAPSRSIMEHLWKLGASICAYDPAAMQETRRIYGERDDLELAADPMAALAGASALLIVTEWREFRSVCLEQVRELLLNPLVFDGRNLYDPERASAAGLEYFCVGRSHAPAATLAANAGAMPAQAAPLGAAMGF